MAISAQQVKELREQTGAGMMDCKKALTEADGDVAKARTWLREKGLSRAAGKSGRITNEGIVESYIHKVGGAARVGAMVELNCETDFVARTDVFRDLGRELALQVASVAPQWVRREEVPASLVDAERAIYRNQVEGKPEAIAEKILSGKLDSYFAGVCLLEQPWIRDGKKSVKTLVSDAVATLGENITVARFARFEIGKTAPDDDSASSQN